MSKTEIDKENFGDFVSKMLEYKEIEKRVEKLTFNQLTDIIRNLEVNFHFLNSVFDKRLKANQAERKRKQDEITYGKTEEERKVNKEKERIMIAKGLERVESGLGGTGPPTKIEKPSNKKYSLEQLQDFDPVEIDGEEYNVNVRGDVVDNDGKYQGQYDSERDRIIPSKRPSDWNEIFEGDESESESESESDEASSSESDEATPPPKETKGTTMLIDEAKKIIQNPEVKPQAIMKGTTRPIEEVRKIPASNTFQELKKAGETVPENLIGAIDEVKISESPGGTTISIKKATRIVSKKYSLEKLQDFMELNYMGLQFSVNHRGDVVDNDGEFLGHWDGVNIVYIEKPADWATVFPSTA
jgi:hypothetical protein